MKKKKDSMMHKLRHVPSHFQGRILDLENPVSLTASEPQAFVSSVTVLQLQPESVIKEMKRSLRAAFPGIMAHFLSHKPGTMQRKVTESLRTEHSWLICTHE